MNVTTTSGLLWSLLLSLPVLAIIFSSSQLRWKIAELLMGINLLLTVAAWVNAVIIKAVPPASSLMQLNSLNCTVLVLISFIPLVVLRYAKSNLESDPDDARFLKWFIATVLAVIITVTTNNLFVFWAAWMAISLSLHQLLMFYPERPRARLAAHKKFIFARLAEMLLAAAFLLLYINHGTATISEIIATYATATSLNGTEQLVAVLLAAVALIKCAQLPLHGWLIQVVEAPTPVSALLHAGVINLGGFLLLVFAPLFSLSSMAQWLVLVVAGLSTIIAALVITTRISIKVRLAWSTIAQMGLMLVQCALGLYELALLHLLAHSCYKAHAFLNSGSTVNQYLHQEFVKVKLPSFGAWSLAFTVSIIGVAALFQLFDMQAPFSPWVLAVIAVSTLLAFRFSCAMSLSLTGTLIIGLLALALYSELKWSVSLLIPAMHSSYSMLPDIWISSLFVVLMATYFYLQYCPQHTVARKLFVALNAGFYLDEWASRTTLRIWPIRLPSTSGKKFNTLEEAVS